jgi:hypothetical protein
VYLATSELATAEDREGLLENYYTRIHRIWQRGGQRLHGRPFFAGSVSRLHRDNRLGMAVIHGGGSATAAKKGGDKVVAFFDRHCNEDRREAEGDQVEGPTIATAADAGDEHARCPRRGPCGWRRALRRKKDG